jgi:hypothetical protein
MDGHCDAKPNWDSHSLPQRNSHALAQCDGNGHAITQSIGDSYSTTKSNGNRQSIRYS